LGKWVDKVSFTLCAWAKKELLTSAHMLSHVVRTFNSGNTISFFLYLIEKSYILEIITRTHVRDYDTHHACPYFSYSI